MVLVLLGASVLGWTTRGIQGVRESQFWMRACVLPLLLVLWLLVWGDLRREKLPDLLRAVGRPYFEHDGLCFHVTPLVRDRQFFWRVAFQNRYERTCEGVIRFRPAVRSLGITRPALAEATADVRCPGAAFGFAIIPYAIDQRYHGKVIRFEVAAVTRYPEGKGKLLRFRDGLKVGTRHKSGGDLALLALAGLAGHLHYTSQATFKVRLPAQVSDQAVGEETQQIVWQPTNSPRVD